MKVGLLGGSFDPVHKGHLKLGLAALNQCKLDHVYFVLTPHSPFKNSHTPTSLAHRYQMLKLALKNKKKLSIGLWELKRKGPSYTITTLRQYKKKHPHHELFLILGSDAYNGFSKWKSPQEILSIATLVVGRRSKRGQVSPHPTLSPRGEGRVRGDLTPLVLKGIFPDISSTQIRRARKKSYSIKKWVVPSVAKYMEKHSLYE